jgi:hypothetical protein
LKITLGSFQIFMKISEDTVFAGQGTPPVSMTPLANFPTGIGVVVDTGGKFSELGDPDISSAN